MPPGAARTVFEKFEDASLVHKLTGATPEVSIHVGWDDPDEAPFDRIQPSSFRRLRDLAQKNELSIGTVSPTYFLEGTHYGSLSANSLETRGSLIEHSLTAAEIASRYGSGILTLWFPDGSLYPGQVNIRTAERNLKESLKEIYREMPESVRMLIEYKLFEPGTYHTVISDTQRCGRPRKRAWWRTVPGWVRSCWDGLLLLTCGPYGNVIRWIPPLIIDKSQLDEALTIFQGALAATVQA